MEERTQELKEKADELKEFAFRASHDLKEPLRSLRNYPDLLAKNYGAKMDEQFEKWISKTLDAVKRSSVLFNAIKVYSEYLQKDREPQPTDCGAVAEGACMNLQAAIEESGAEVMVGALPTVLGTPQLILLFQNLLANAIKYRDHDRPLRVEVGARPRDDGWLFWVRDNGIGIESKYLERIFELGERLHTASSKYHGTGYGLAICEQIVGATAVDLGRVGLRAGQHLLLHAAQADRARSSNVRNVAGSNHRRCGLVSGGCGMVRRPGHNRGLLDWERGMGIS